MTTKELENYTPKGQLEGFPKEIIARMLECQKEQVDRRDVTVFENLTRACPDINGFSWNKTKEGYDFWEAVIEKRNFDLFFERYPKKEEDSQKFRVGDKVINIITGQIGVVSKINILINELAVLINTNENIYIYYNLDGKFNNTDKYPRLLHYRDDYDYDVIDFNNLPKRQEPKRWRAKKGQRYYYIDKLFEVSSFMEENHITDTKLYNLGNYFQTEKEAQELADIIKKCFQELINKSF